MASEFSRIFDDHKNGDKVPLVPGDEYCVSRKLTKFKQVGRPTDAVVRTGLNGTQSRHFSKGLVSFIINCFMKV